MLVFASMDVSEAAVRAASVSLEMRIARIAWVDGAAEPV
jgi:hypothetical protein